MAHRTEQGTGAGRRREGVARVSGSERDGKRRTGAGRAEEEGRDDESQRGRAVEEAELCEREEVLVKNSAAERRGLTDGSVRRRGDPERKQGSKTGRRAKGGGARSPVSTPGRTPI